MKLEGSLDAFGLPDVLHLLHATAKTGALHLTRERSGAVIHLVDGSVASGIMLDAGPLSLLRRLIGQGLVDEAMVATAAMAASETGEGLVATLVAHEQVGTDVARAQMHSLIVDTLFDVVRWDAGEFSFAAEELPADDVGVREPPGGLVEEAMLRLPAWEEAASFVPSPDHVAAMVRTGPGEVTLSADDWSLLALIDGRRTVAQIVDQSGLGAFNVVVRLADLAGRGCIEHHGDAAGAQAHLAARQDILRMLDAAEGLRSEPSEDIDVDMSPEGDVGSSEPEDSHLIDPVSLDTGSAPSADQAFLTQAGPTGGATVVSVPTGAPSAQAAEQVAHPAPPIPPALSTRSDGDLLGGAHHPGDVVPPRPEPFLPSRRPDHPDAVGRTVGNAGEGAMHMQIVGANAVLTDPSSREEPSTDLGSDVVAGVPLNRSMVLRLIAGVRGL